MEVIFIDHAPVKQKSDIRQGGQIRRYYAWTALNKMVERVTPFRKENGSINWNAVKYVFNKDSRIWIEYGCGGTAHFFALFASFIGSNKIILNIHDFAILQRRDFDKDPSFMKRFRLHIIEQLLIRHAHTIILAWPKMLDYFTPAKKQKLLIMVPGVGEDELFVHPSNKKNNGRKIALYFGGMKRKSMIPWIVELFSELKEWELHLVGLREEEEIVERENVLYTGPVSHNKLFDIMCNADLILIPNPRNDYMDRQIPMKVAYTLLSCKPVVSTRLQGLYEYISMLGLQENMIYLDEWNHDSLKEALHKADNINIDADKTIEKLKPFSWEPRFRKAIEIILDGSQNSVDQIKWI
ncbi:MAG TPA: glycosyltransferase [Candidatus Methylomirabilis sp.]|nr:glycosyltransferase [Candidatus Methylomirabilis sp.]